MNEREYHKHLGILVDSGLKYLDEKYPGWADDIDLDRLDIGDICGCITGQLDIDPDDADELGFWRPKYLPYDAYPTFYDDIQKYWEPEIKARQTV